jgi:hypothetical protein
MIETIKHNWKKLPRRSKNKMTIGLIVSIVAITIINFTDIFSPTYSYVRLRNGTEFHNVPVKWTSDIHVRIDGEYYLDSNIDSLVW